MISAAASSEVRSAAVCCANPLLAEKMAITREAPHVKNFGFGMK
jgi:hypothetical protein